MAMRFALFSDIIGMAYDTLRANKLRASLTILAVVIAAAVLWSFGSPGGVRCWPPSCSSVRC